MTGKAVIEERGRKVFTLNKVLVLGTGNAQKDILEYLKEKEYFVIASSNAAGYPAQKLADRFYQVDITDAAATTELAEREQVDFVYSVGSDVAMPTIAKVSRDLGLPCFVEYETAEICNHKNLLRQVLEENGIEGNISYQTIESIDETIHITFPAMMKPSDSQGQRGVRMVHSAEDVKAHFEDVIGFSREKKVILESYIEGDEISVNAFLQDGELKFYLISDREVWEEYPGGIIREHFIPSKYERNPEISAKVRLLVERVLSAIGLKNGPVYFQIIISRDGQPFLIEVTPRLDGCHMWRAIKYATGVDLLEASVDLLEGKAYAQPLVFAVKPYSLEFMCGKPGTVFSTKNYSLPEHVFLCWYYADGDLIAPLNGYFEKCGYVVKEGDHFISEE